MTKLRIEKGASRVRHVPLKATIDGSVSDDIDLFCQWSDNETSYVVNHLLRFAFSQSEEFQRYKQSLGPEPAAPSPKSATGPAAQTSSANRTEEVDG